jgi:hypothetical protein
MPIHEVMDAKKKQMFKSIGEFSVFKQILDKNSMMLGISLESLRNSEISKELFYDLQTQMFKTVDCKLIHVLLNDLKR